MHAQRVHQRALKSGHRAGLEAHTHVDQGDFGGLGVFAKQLQVNIGVAGGGAAPDCAAQVGPKARQAAHPVQSQFAQRAQLRGLGVGAKNGDVFLDCRFQLRVVGQTAAHTAELLGGAALGRAVVQAFFHHQAGGGGCDLFLVTVHGAIVPRHPWPHA